MKKAPPVIPKYCMTHTVKKSDSVNTSYHYGSTQAELKKLAKTLPGKCQLFKAVKVKDL